MDIAPVMSVETKKVFELSATAGPFGMNSPISIPVKIIPTKQIKRRESIRYFQLFLFIFGPR